MRCFARSLGVLILVPLIAIMKRVPSRRTQNSLATIDSEEVEALASSCSSSGLAEKLSLSVSDSSSSPVAVLPGALSSYSSAVVSQSSSVELPISLPLTVSSQPSGSSLKIPAVGNVGQLSSFAVASSTTLSASSPSFQMPYRPSVLWPVVSLSSVSSSPLCSPPASVASSFVQPPSLFSPLSLPGNPLPPAQASSPPAAFDSIAQQAPDPVLLNQFLAVNSELEQSQARSAALTRESLALRARLMQTSSTPQPGIVAPSVPSQSLLAPTGMRQSQLFGVPPLKQPIVVGPGFSPVPPKVVASIVGGSLLT